MFTARTHNGSGWHNLSVAELNELHGQPSASGADDLLWIRVHDPGPQELDRVHQITGILLPHTLSQLHRTDSSPHIDFSNDTMVIVLRTLSYFEETSDVETGVLAMIIQPGRVVTLDWFGTAVVTAGQGLLDFESSKEPISSWTILRALLTAAVSEYSQVEHALSDDVSDLERLVFSSEKRDPVEDIYELKREVSEARRAILPFLEPAQDLAAGVYEAIPTEFHRGAIRLAASMSRIIDRIDSHDSLLGDMLSAYYSIVSVQQNSDMRKISAWAAMIAVPTAIAGIYGMNFTHMPELSWQFGYPIAISLMVASCLILFRLFKRSGWL